jgi:hypothetical protein
VALTRWRWLWGPALAALVLAILLLPPQVPQARGLLASFGLFETYWEFGPGNWFRESLRAAIDGNERLVVDATLADSLLAAARGSRALHSADGSVAVVYETPLTADSARVWLRAASAELALYPKATSGGLPIVVGLLSNPARERSRRGDDWSLRFGTRALFSAASSRGACVVTVTLLSRAAERVRRLVAHDASGQPLGRFLDLCAVYGSFGLPGVAVGQWSQRGHNMYLLDRDPLALRMQEARRTLSLQEVSTSSEDYWFAGVIFWREVGCLRGATTLCERASGLMWEPERRYFRSYFFSGGQLLAFMLTQGTPAQFAAFWRSPMPPAEALASAYGRPAGRVALSAFSHWYSATSLPGPRADGRVVLAGLVWAGAALAVAALVGGRRKTEP